MSALTSALRERLPPGFSLRDRVESDLPFLAALYASTREDELKPVPWLQEQKRAFLTDQFLKQHTHYLEHYPGAQWLVLQHEDQPAGRLYAWTTQGEIRLMDIALLPGYRNRGLGTLLMRALVDFADRSSVCVTLHVEPYNPAMRLYERLGFENIESRGYYQYMKRPAGGAIS